MAIFRLFLAAIFLTILIYTNVVIANHGMGLLPIFFGDIATMGWPGQFNVDFSSFLLMTLVWVAWRNDFSAPGQLLACLVPVGGGMFTSGYLLFLLWQTKADMPAVLLGARRAAALRR